MKTTTTLVLLGFLVLGHVTVAQNTASLDELLDRLHGNHMGSIHDVFSNDEIAQLRAYFDEQTSSEPIRYNGDEMLIRTTENTQANLANIDPSNLSMVEIIAPSPLAEFEGAGATIPDSNNAVIVDNNNNFYFVSPSGDYEPIDQIQPAAGQSFTGLEFTSDGALYGIATDGMGSSALYVIDIGAGTATQVGTDNGLVVGIALGRDMNNNLYSYDIDTDMVHRIDRVTGIATLLGPIGFDAEFGQGMSYDGMGDNLVASVFNSDTFKPELRTIDITTGASTLIGTIVPAQTFQFAWMSFLDPTLGVNNLETTPFLVYPNPANNVLHISTELAIDSIKIYNMLGQLMLSQTEGEAATAIAIADLSRGVYSIHITSGTVESSLKFIKK